MDVDLKRAFLAGIALWVGIFFEVSALMFGLGLTGQTYYLIHYVIAGIISACAGLYYFKNSAGGIREGISTGLVMLFCGIVLDALITVPFFVKDYGFFLSFPLLLGYIESVAVIAAVGLAREKQSRKSKRAVALGTT